MPLLAVAAALARMLITPVDELVSDTVASPDKAVPLLTALAS